LAGLSDQERFVQLLYLDELGRRGSLLELDGWVHFLSTPLGSRSFVAIQIEHSPEARERLVATWYRTYLGRSPTNGEEWPWVQSLLVGSSEEAVLGGILSSPEFYNRAQSLVGVGSPDERFVQALYVVLLNRLPPASEAAGWAHALPRLGRTDVVHGFLHSDEFRTNLVDSYYISLLHRSSDPLGELRSLSMGYDSANLRLKFESSPEFAAGS
jgi:hypothetical protein